MPPGNSACVVGTVAGAAGAQWVCCLFWLCDFPVGINDIFDGSEDAFVPG